MKKIGLRSIAIGAICASLLGAASFASAGDWHSRGFRGHSGVRFGIGLSIGIGAPVYAAPVYADPYYNPYVAPYAYPYAYGPEVVIGGYYHGGHYYRGHARRWH